ncbi:MAG: ROK family protein [Anaerolineaceae bacterium]|jgi:fructokinase|nr:ROK family protein [Anaerolineaceae bacterium]
MSLYGGVEAGGTKFVCIVAGGPGDIREEVRFPTTTPDETLSRTIKFFSNYMRDNEEKLEAIGVACFGPVDLDKASPTYGFITSTPKPGWANTDVVARIEKALNVPVAFDTDVNGAAVGEGKWGAAQGLSSFIYLTIGTGIGGGAIVDGKPIHGLVHPEMGHIMLAQDVEKDPFEGYCPFHGTCFEGLCSGPALQAHWGKPAQDLDADHPAWQLEAHYIAEALHIFVTVLSPQRIILGGGVMQQAHLFPLIREKVKASLNGYVQSPAILEEIDAYIVPPGLGNRAGVLGALALAQGM